MRVLHVISSLLAPLGGAELYCLAVARGQRARGEDVTIATGWISPEVASSLAADGIPVIVVPSRRPYPPDRKGPRVAKALFHGLDLVGSVVTPRAMRRALARGSDVVHVHRVAGFGTALLRDAEAPVVMTAHDFSLVDTGAFLLRDGVEPARPPLVQRLRTRLVNRTLGHVRLVYPTARVRDRLMAWGMRPDVAGTVIPHGWDLGRAPLPPAPHSGTVFLFLGRYLDAKGVGLLLEAWGDGIPGAELRFAGDGPDRAALDAAVAAGRVSDLGWLDAESRAAALAGADVLVTPSLWPENFQLTAAEGMLAGLPVLSTTVAAPAAVEDGVSGMLVPPTVDALRAAMGALTDLVAREPLAAGARRRAEELDLGLHLDRLDALYREVGAAERTEVTG